MSAAQIIAQLTAAAQKLEGAQAKLLTARQETAEARALVHDALQGSSAQLAGQIGGLVDALEQVASRTPATMEQIRMTIAKVQALGN